jgi:sugar/nucleoside kinase (ribokinase family)
MKPEWLAGVDALYVSGYALMRDPVGAAGEAAARAVRADGGVVSVDLSTWSSIRAFGPDRFLERVAGLKPDVVFATELELDELHDVPEVETIVLKRGPAGAVVRQGGEDAEYEARETEVVDSTGAGDALAAGFLVGGIELGLDAAARCVAKLGAMP